MPSKSGADLFWGLMGLAAVIVASGIAQALVMLVCAPCGCGVG